MTNREWLNTLTDEQFAYWHINIGCGTCAYTFKADSCPNYTTITSVDAEKNCVDGVSKWLKQEYKGEVLK